MSDTSAPLHDERGAPPERLAPAIGVFVVIVATSSLLDDSGAVEHPWWMSLVIAAGGLALALVARTVSELVHFDRR